MVRERILEGGDIEASSYPRVRPKTIQSPYSRCDRYKRQDRNSLIVSGVVSDLSDLILYPNPNPGLPLPFALGLGTPSRRPPPSAPCSSKLAAAARILPIQSGPSICFISRGGWSCIRTPSRLAIPPSSRPFPSAPWALKDAAAAASSSPDERGFASNLYGPGSEPGSGFRSDVSVMGALDVRGGLCSVRRWKDGRGR